MSAGLVCVSMLVIHVQGFKLPNNKALFLLKFQVLILSPARPCLSRPAKPILAWPDQTLLLGLDLVFHIIIKAQPGPARKYIYLIKARPGPALKKPVEARPGPLPSPNSRTHTSDLASF